MQACVDVTFPYAHLRESFGKKIGEHQVRFWSPIVTSAVRNVTFLIVDPYVDMKVAFILSMVLFFLNLETVSTVQVKSLVLINSWRYKL